LAIIELWFTVVRSRKLPARKLKLASAEYVEGDFDEPDGA